MEDINPHYFSTEPLFVYPQKTHDYGTCTIEQTGKTVLKSLQGGVVSCPESMIQSDFNSGVVELKRCGFVTCHEEENGNVEVARLTDKGKLYLEDNPALHDPVDWKWVVTTAVTVVAAIAGLFVSCAIYSCFDVSG